MFGGAWKSLIVEALTNRSFSEWRSWFAHGPG